MSARTGVALLLFLASLAPAHGGAADWGGITPGESDVDTVRQIYGTPSRELRQKVEGFDTVQWIYEGDRAPKGFVRMEVNFGLMIVGGYRPGLVRYFRLEPRPGVFTKEIVLAGWGAPSRAGKEKVHTIFYYQAGLVVYFDEAELNAVAMVFAVPQPDLPAGR